MSSTLERKSWVKYDGSIRSKCVVLMRGLLHVERVGWHCPCQGQLFKLMALLCRNLLKQMRGKLIWFIRNSCWLIKILLRTEGETGAEWSSTRWIIIVKSGLNSKRGDLIKKNNFREGVIQCRIDKAGGRGLSTELTELWRSA